MPNNPTLYRLGLIIRWVQSEKSISFKELLRRYQKEMEPMLLDRVANSDSFSQRTFQRDLANLRKYFSIDLVYDRKAKGYKLEGPPANNRSLPFLLDSLDMYKLMQMKPLIETVVFPDERRAKGSEHMHLLLHAITNHLQLEFTYQKFDGDPPYRTISNPLALKEFKNRWYLLAFADGKSIVKTYCLDRMSDLKLSDRKFDPAEAENWRPKFDCVFGITSGDPQKTEDVILSFKPKQGRYVQALKLHPTQNTLVDIESEIRIGLRLCITFDFQMELLSYGPEVEVLAPESLREDLAKMLEKGFRRYSIPAS